MLIGGVLITIAYRIKLRAEEDDRRPHVVQRLTEVFGGRDQNNQAFTTDQLKGKLTLFTPISGVDEARMAQALRMMKEVAEKYPDEKDLLFLGITVDPENDGLEELKAMLKKVGVDQDERWIFVQAEEDAARGYVQHKIRVEFKEKIPSPDGPIERFRSTVVFIDGNLHVLEPQFDFNHAHEVQEDAVRMLKEEPDKAEKYKAREHTDDLKRAEERFYEILKFIRDGNLREG